jgi:hypothetical protein
MPPTPSPASLRMLFWLYDLPTPVMAAAFVGFFLAVHILGLLLIRPLIARITGIDAELNDHVAVILSAFGIFYGILLGLLAVATFQTLSDVERTVAKEAGHMRTLYRTVAHYPSPHDAELKTALKDYWRWVIEEAWPAQQRGETPEKGVELMNAFQQKLVAYEPKTRSHELLHTEAMKEMSLMSETRRMRLHSVAAGIPPLMWSIVALGSAVTYLLVWSLRMPLRRELWLGSLLFAFLGAVIFLIAATDYPFRGKVRIGPEAFEAVYRRMS